MDASWAPFGHDVQMVEYPVGIGNVRIPDGNDVPNGIGGDAGAVGIFKSAEVVPPDQAAARGELGNIPGRANIRVPAADDDISAAVDREAAGIVEFGACGR